MLFYQNRHIEGSRASEAGQHTPSLSTHGSAAGTLPQPPACRAGMGLLMPRPDCTTVRAYFSIENPFGAIEELRFW